MSDDATLAYAEEHAEYLRECLVPGNAIESDHHHLEAALRALDTAEKRVRRAKSVPSMAITIDHIDKARLHVRASMHDAKRAGR